jgi:hypothetical protein
MTMDRRMLAPFLVGILLVAAALGWVVGPPVLARTQPTATVAEGPDLKVTYPPIPGNFPLTQAAVPTPSGCASEGQFTTMCDVIPLVVEVPPGLGEGDDFTLELQVAWEDPSQGNDLDIYFWDDRQIARRDDPQAATYTELGKSDTQDNPEKITVFRPELGRYNLTVVNFLGANIGYELTARVVRQTFENPFEAVAPPPTPPPPAPTGEAPPVEAPAEPAPAPPPDAGAGVAVPAPLDEAPVAPDQDFTGFGPSAFGDQLTAPQPAPRLPTRLVAAGPPAPVPAIVLLFWLVVVPLALVAGGALLIKRRSRMAIRL